jgi:hypothetical protein
MRVATPHRIRLTGPSAIFSMSFMGDFRLA